MIYLEMLMIKEYYNINIMLFLLFFHPIIFIKILSLTFQNVKNMYLMYHLEENEENNPISNYILNTCEYSSIINFDNFLDEKKKLSIYVTISQTCSCFIFYYLI